MKRNGIDFFPFPSSNTTALQLFETKCKLRGVAIYLKLLQKIFYEEGYFYKISNDIILLINKEFGVNDDIVLDVINECLTRGLFDKSMYEKYNILTSDDIQKDYLNAVRKRKYIEIKEEYRLPFACNFFKKAEEIEKTAEDLLKMAEEMNKGEESKVKESKVINVEEGNNLLHSTNEQDFPTLIDKFKNATNKYVGDVKVIPIGVNIDLLIEKVNNSDFLKNAPNFTLKQCLKNYDKIIAGVYDNDSNRNRNLFKNNSAKPTAEHHTNERTYTTEELNSFFTNIDDIKF